MKSTKSFGISTEWIQTILRYGESFPTLCTIMNYCQLFGMCPGWLVLLSCQVDKGKIKEEEFFEMIKNWKSYMQLAEMKIDEFLKMAHASIGWKQV
ncbi:MAG: hypothetical protein WC865_10750 [Bacteroidales bacterium]